MVNGEQFLDGAVAEEFEGNPPEVAELKAENGVLIFSSVLLQA